MIMMIIIKVEITFLLYNFKEFEIFLWKKRRFRLRWDWSSGLSIAGRLICCSFLIIVNNNSLSIK